MLPSTSILLLQVVLLTRKLLLAVIVVMFKDNVQAQASTSVALLFTAYVTLNDLLVWVRCLAFWQRYLLCCHSPLLTLSLHVLPHRLLVSVWLGEQVRHATAASTLRHDRAPVRKAS